MNAMKKIIILHYFPVTVIANYHKPAGFRQQIFTLSQFQRPSGGGVTHSRSQERILREGESGMDRERTIDLCC